MSYKHSILVPWLWLSLLGGCASVPPEIVTYTEALRDNAQALGAAHSGTVDAYHTIITDVNDRCLSLFQTTGDEYEKDVQLLVQRNQELSDAYQVLAGAVQNLLDASANATRDQIADPDTQTVLRTAIQAENAQAARSKDAVQAVAASLASKKDGNAFAEFRSLTQQFHDVLARKNDQTRDQLKATAEHEHGTQVSGFDPLINYLRSLLSIEEERKHFLSGAERQLRKVQESEKLVKFTNIFDELIRFVQPKEK